MRATAQSDQEELGFDQNSLRDPAEVMRPERLGALKQTRLSFGRLLMEEMVDERWDIELDRWEVDERGVGRFVYRIETPTQLLSFGVFSHDTDGETTDRIIADDWDMWGFLCEGEATPELMDHQAEQLPHVREGRATSDVLMWARANRSRRFFGHVVEALENGHQPDVDYLSQGGYLMRSSGFYGNGYNGTKMFRAFDSDHPLKGPYAAQMLSVYMLRVFSYDLADRMAQARTPDAATLDPEVKRYMGTGNSSGVGIVHYLINHPQLFNAWIQAREIALARVKTVAPTDDDVRRFETLLNSARRWFYADDSDTGEYFLDKDRIADGLDRIGQRLDAYGGDADSPRWGRLCDWTEANLETETQEVLHSLLIDAHPEVCAGLTGALRASETRDLQAGMSVSELRSLVESSYEWALEIDMSAPGARKYFWYRSVDNEEPRIGVRGEHDYEAYGFPIDVANRVQELLVDLSRWDGTDSVATFVLEHPEHRDTVARVQAVADLPYAEIRTNPLDADFVPLSFISCFKALLGIQRAHPKSKGWVRGTFYQGAPIREDVRDGEGGYWLYPEQPEQTDPWRTDRCD